MNPVIQRELREQARTPALFRLRLVAATVLLAALAWGMWGLQAQRQRSTVWVMAGGMMAPRLLAEGTLLFTRLHQALMLTIIALVPSLTADAIARERREATLGLLGLTPLRPLAVVLGKSAANALRALTLWLAAVPILTVPLLMGGVGAAEVATAVTLQLTVLAVGLAAGLAASAVTVQFRRALALAYVLEVALLGAMLWLSPVLAFLLNVVNQVGGGPIKGDLFWLARRPGLLFMFFDPVYGGLSDMLSIVLSGGRLWGAWAAGLLIFVGSGMLITGLTLQLVARRVALALQEEPPRPETLELQRKLTRPVLFPGWIRRQQRRRLSQNPLLWLQHRTVASSLTRWGWIGAVIAAWMSMVWEGSFLHHMGDELAGLMVWAVPVALLGGMVFSAAGGFRAERESGTLELLLVTPLTARQLLQSRALAHLREFLLPVALQLGLVAYVTGEFRRGGLEVSRLNWWLVSSLFVVPWIGLWRGLRARTFVTAVLGTTLWGFVLPAMLTIFLRALSNPLFFAGPASLGGPGGFRFFVETRLDWGVVPALFQVGMGGVAALAVWRELTTRQFALGAVGRI